MTSRECTGCSQATTDPGLCAWCRAAVRELSPLRLRTADEILDGMKEALDKWATPEGLTATEKDMFIAAFKTLDEQARHGKLPDEWAWPEGDMEPAPQPSPMETIKSDLL